MSRRDFVILLSLAIIVLGFVAYEMAGLLLPGWHTISFYAHASTWLDYGITGLIAGAGAVGVWWWRRHMRSRIPR